MNLISRTILIKKKKPLPIIKYLLKNFVKNFVSVKYILNKLITKIEKFCIIHIVAYNKNSIYSA